MEHIIGKDWRDYFDLLIVQAGKPKFFTDPSRPLRIYHEQSDNCTWDRVTKLEKGNVYYEVSNSCVFHEPVCKMNSLL